MYCSFARAPRAVPDPDLRLLLYRQGLACRVAWRGRPPPPSPLPPPPQKTVCAWVTVLAIPGGLLSGLRSPAAVHEPTRRSALPTPRAAICRFRARFRKKNLFSPHLPQMFQVSFMCSFCTTCAWSAARNGFLSRGSEFRDNVVTAVREAVNQIVKVNSLKKVVKQSLPSRAADNAHVRKSRT